MAIRVALHHRTSYRYAESVNLTPHIVRLRPAPHTRTPLHRYSLQIEPGGHFLNWQQDPFGNHVARAVFPEASDQLTVTVDLVADLVAINPFDFFLDDDNEHYPLTYATELASDLAPYLKAAPVGAGLKALLKDIDSRAKAKKERIVDFLVACNQIVRDRVDYVIRMEPGVQTPEETLKKASGSCRDSGWLLVQVLRNLGIAARFVSGYLVQLVPDRKAVDGPSGPDEDFTDLHAWCEAYVPGAGWIGLDATSGLLTAEGHIPLACTPEPPSAAPITGSYLADEPVETEFEFDMTVTRLEGDGRPSKPYVPETWERIQALGSEVDRRLAEQGLPLTTGGEPTLVCSEDPDADEWTTAALGPGKWRKANRLMDRLHPIWGPGGALHHGQGKWYPGEELPRWALSCYYRKDGEALWEDSSRFADIEQPPGDTHEAGEALIAGIAKRLGVYTEHARAGYEDAWYHLWRERRLPTNVDPFDSKLDDPLERKRLGEVFRRGLDTPVGHVLPLRHWNGFWESGEWFLRDERLYLLPGDSAMGYRLPLDSLPWEPKDERFENGWPDPMEQRKPLPPRTRTQHPGDIDDRGVPDQVVRSALCVEARDGILRVFLPPTASLEAFCELLAAVEDTAAEQGRQVLLEGYHPPEDHRLGVFRLTPDPGVLEVNVSPVSSWPELVEQNDQLFREAEQEKLVAEKFLLDGRQTGTGGGAHLVLGGPSPADSPFLNRPKLLADLVAYLHNHPALSYGLSGMFVGPTSQAPRIDEARMEATYELQRALDLVPETGPCPPWLVDRLLRHCLVDVTGNTHRTQLCVDKLFSPDGPTGRLGLVELRAFEMPPHEHMLDLQQVLMRALVAHLDRNAPPRRLIHWGGALHDRFLLHHFCRQDLGEICDELSRNELPLDINWMDPHLDLRFPTCGELSVDGMQVVLRHAIEPWHVLGEEATAGGQSRFVDSSMERVEVLVRNLHPERHSVVVNGWRAPLHPTGRPGEWVCGVRFRAWQPPSCLHPTVGVQAPLRLSIQDEIYGKAIAGCTYHVMHSGGRNYEFRPVNAEAAEGRRLERFQDWGHQVNFVEAKEPPANRLYPHTLDLRHLDV